MTGFTLVSGLADRERVFTAAGRSPGPVGRDASRGEPPVCFGGLFRADISHSQCEDALFGLAPKPIEEGGVGG